jgi:hypothetical protein
MVWINYNKQAICAKNKFKNNNNIDNEYDEVQLMYR